MEAILTHATAQRLFAVKYNDALSGHPPANPPLPDAVVISASGAHRIVAAAMMLRFRAIRRQVFPRRWASVRNRT
jgi:hypothetical protein